MTDPDQRATDTETTYTKSDKELSAITMDLIHAMHTVDVMLGNGHSVQMDGYNAADWTASTSKKLVEYLEANEHIGLDYEMLTWAMEALEDVTLKLMIYENERDVEPEDVEAVIRAYVKLSVRYTREPNEDVMEGIVCREQDKQSTVSNNQAGFITRKQLKAYLGQLSWVRTHSIDISTLEDADEHYNSELGSVEQYEVAIEVFCSPDADETKPEWWVQEISGSAESAGFSAANVHFKITVDDMDKFDAFFAARFNKAENG